MPESADLVERVDQSVLILGLKCNVEVSGGVRVRGTKALPVIWDGLPGMLHLHVIPR